MDAELQTFFTDLCTSSKSNTPESPADCFKLLDQLNNNLTKEELGASQLENYFYHIFNKDNGLLVFLNNVCHNSAFRNATIKCTEIIYALINNFPKIINENILDINEACLSVFLKAHSASEKVKALNVITLGFEKINDKCVDNLEKYECIYSAVKSFLSQAKAVTVKEAIFISLGTFAKQFSYVPSNAFKEKEFKHLFINHLEDEVRKIHCQSTLNGIFTGLTFLLHGCPFDINKDQILIEKLYKSIQDVVRKYKKATSSKTGIRAALTFFGENANLFVDQLFSDYQRWQVLLETLAKGVSCGNSEIKVAQKTLVQLYSHFSKYLLNKNLTAEEESQSRTICQFYFDLFEKYIIFRDDEDQIFEQTSVQGVNYFYACFRKYLDPAKVLALKQLILGNFETLVNSDDANWEVLPFYIHTVTNIGRYKQLNTSESFLLQKCLISIIKSFPKRSFLDRGLVVECLVLALESVHSSANFRQFLHLIVYEGVLWTCSHNHVSDLALNKDLITIKLFLPLWSGLLNIVNQSKYDKYDISVFDRRALQNSILNELIRTLLVLIGKLNTNLEECKDCGAVTDVNKLYKVQKQDDFQIFLNVVDLYCELFQIIPAEKFRNCIEKFLTIILENCWKNYLISGFYKILSSLLKIATKLDLFTFENKDSTILINLKDFLQMLLLKMRHFKDELFISCVYVVLESPPVVLVDHLDSLPELFVRIFDFGRSDLVLANSAMKTLEIWQSHPDLNKLDVFDKFLIKVLPELDAFLRSNQIRTVASNDNETKWLKKDRALKKRRIEFEFQSELVQLQRNILKFIGRQRNDIALSLIETRSGNTDLINSKSDILSVTVGDCDLYFDQILPRVIELSLHCTDRKTRVTACEFLHALTLIFLGRSRTKPLDSEDPDNLLKILAWPLLKLACDVDLIIQQLFQPLFMQIIHLYTNKNQMRERHLNIILESILDGVTSGSDANLRDFSGKCIKEYVKWTIKQSALNSFKHDSRFIKYLIKKIQFFAFHPDGDKKLGAALIFNNIYQEMREELDLVDLFWIELLYIFINSLDSAEIGEDEGTLKQLELAVDHLERVFVEKSARFNSPNAMRRLPVEIKGSTLKDISLYLLKMSGSKNGVCRRKCMDLFKVFVIHAGFKNYKSFIEESFGGQSDWIREIYKLNSILVFPLNDVNSTIKHLESFACLIEGYNFVVSNNLLEIDINDSNLLSSIQNYINISGRNIKEFSKSTVQQTKSFTSLKSSCLEALLKFLNTLLVHDKYKQNCQIFSLPEFLDFLSVLPFNLYNFTNNRNIWPLLNDLLSNIYKLDSNKELHSKICRYCDQTIVFPLLEENVSLSARKCIDALAKLPLLQNNLPFSPSCVTETVIRNFLVNLKDKIIYLSGIPEATLSYYNNLLFLALKDEQEVKILLENLFKDLHVQDLDSDFYQDFGIYLYNVFSEVIPKVLIDNFDLFLNVSSLKGNNKLSFEFVMKILDHVQLHKMKFISQSKEIVAGLLSNWTSFEGYFFNSLEGVTLGINLIHRMTTLSSNKQLDNRDLFSYLFKLMSKNFDWPVKDIIDVTVEAILILSDILPESTPEDCELESNLKKSLDKIMDCSTIVSRKLLLTTPKNIDIFTFFIDVLLNCKVDLEDLESFLTRSIKSNTSHQQDQFLNLVFPKLNSDLLAILPPLFIFCDDKVFERFFVSHISDIVDVLKKPTLQSLQEKTNCLKLVELLYLRLPLNSEGNPLSDIKVDGRGLNAFLFSSAISVVKESIPNGPKEGVRKYKCQSYNTTVSIVTSLKNDKFYDKLFTRSATNGDSIKDDTLWSCLIDLEKNYVFPLVFDNLPKERKHLIAIRNELRQTDGERDGVNYIESQILFNSTLSEDVSKFDFSNTVVRSDIANSANFSQIQLESNDINEHECMPTVCALIRHIFDEGISTLPSEDFPVELPNWMKIIKALLANQNTPKNVKIFWLQVVKNLEFYFGKFSSSFTLPILQFLCQDDERLNHFSTDLIALLASWSKFTEITEEEKLLVDKVVSKLIKELQAIDSDKVIKYYLELVKLIVETWSANFQYPQMLPFFTSSDSNKLRTGINLVFIFLANGVQLTVEVFEAIFTKLLSTLENSEKQVFRCCAETLGLFFKCLHDLELDELLSAKLKVFKNKFGDMVSSTKSDNFAILLDCLTLHYPHDLEIFYSVRMLSKLNGFPDPTKEHALKFLYRQVNVIQNEHAFLHFDWNDFILCEDKMRVLLTIEIMIKSLDAFRRRSRDFPKYLTAMQKITGHPSQVIRERVYDFFIELYRMSEGDYKTLAKNILLQAIDDNSLENQEKIYKFWQSNSEISTNLPSRFSYLLSQLYNSDIEDNFLGFTSYLLLSNVVESKEADSILFDPLEQCQFQEYELSTNWRLQNPSLQPLFANTLQSQSHTSDFLNSNEDREDNEFFIRQTVNTLEFAPTAKSLDHTLSQSSLYSFALPSPVQKSSDYKQIRRVLTKKSREQVSRRFADLAVKKKSEDVQKRLDSVKEREKRVTIFRKYRKGDIPDIQITLASVLKPLQSLLKSDSEVSRVFYIAFFKSLSEKVDKEFLQEVADIISEIFKSSSSFNSALMATFMEFLLIDTKHMKVDTGLLVKVAESSGLQSIAALIIEEYLMNFEDQPGPSKRSTAYQSSDSQYWIRLAELLKQLEEWGQVNAIFLHKIRAKETVQEALRLESEGQWRKARDRYSELLKGQQVFDHDIYYESYYKCFMYLGDWQEIPGKIEQMANPSGEPKDIWEKLWEDDWNKRKLLPWYIQSNVKMALGTNEPVYDFLNNLNNSLKILQRQDYLRQNFSEELCLLFLMKKQLTAANHYFKIFLETFINDWQYINPQFYNLRRSKLLQLRNLVDLQEIINCLSGEDFEDQLGHLLSHWQQENDQPIDILSEEMRLLYRNYFLDKHTLDQSSINVQELKLNLVSRFVRNAISFNNFYMAKSYYMTFHDEFEGSVTNVDWDMLSCDLLHLKKNMQLRKEDQLNTLRSILDLQQSNDFKVILNRFHTTMSLYELLKNSPELFAQFRESLGSITNCEEIFVKSIKSLGRKVQEIEMTVEDVHSFQEIGTLVNAYETLASHLRGNQRYPKEFIVYVLKAMQFNSGKARLLFPSILMMDIQQYVGLIHEESAKVPTWMFLSWLPQLLANIDNYRVDAISGIILKIAKEYPQAITYAYRLSKEKIDSNRCSSSAKELILKLDELLLSDPLMDQFIVGLSHICVPTTALKYWLVRLKNAITIEKSEDKFNQIKTWLLTDGNVFGLASSRDVNCMFGNAFKQVAQFRKPFENLQYTSSLQVFQTLHNELNPRKKETPSILLKDYNPWLANFSAAKLNAEIEIPGQYDGSKMPLVQHHIKLSCFNQQVSVMSSKQRPIKLTLIGMDSKEYPFLVKYGEDLRQDQRIQQIFTVINDLLLNDLNCANKQMHLETYQVTPLSSYLGLIQWVQSRPLEEFVKRSVSQDTLRSVGKIYEDKYLKYNKKSLEECHAFAAANFNRQQLKPFFKWLVNEIPADTLRKSFWAFSRDSESFRAYRNNFIKSYAVMCTAHFFLGIGDRHLNNTLLLNNGKVLGIDFGLAFGAATQLIPIPELVPFRLTPHILNMMEPLRELGLFREYLKESLECLRRNPSSLLAVMNVFIEDPSIDWMDQALKRSKSNEDPNNLTEDSVKWYPKQKVKQCQRKLEGASSFKILLEDLEMAALPKSWIDNYLSIFNDYNRDCIDPEHFDVEDQVDILIRHAMDENLLGRMYKGWSPWI